MVKVEVVVVVMMLVVVNAIQGSVVANSIH